MVNATLEIAEKKIQFSGLEELRLELRRQAKNKEYLAQFETTINEALKQNDKDGIIEFTEYEWQKLITDENLPPIEEVKRLEEVKKLLSDKISAMKEVTAETKEKTGGILDEIKTKADEVKKGVIKKVDETKENITAGITEALSPLQKIKDGFSKIGTKIGDFFSGLKFLLYTLGAFLGFKGAKDALAIMAKEKAEKVIEAGKEKAGDKMAEAKEGLMEKTAPLGILAAAGLGIFKLIKDRLPPSLANKLGGVDGKELLNNLATNRALKLFGIGGIRLIGIGKLSEYIENNGATLGEMPRDEAGKKAWWKKAIEKAGIVVKDGAEEIWAIVSGQKVEEVIENNIQLRPGYQYLEDSNLLAGIKGKMRLLGDKLELIYKKNPEAFQASFGLLATAGGVSIATKGLLFRPAMNGVDLLRIVTRTLYKSAKNHPILWAIELALLGSQKELIEHIQVPENMTTENIGEMLGDMADIGEIGAKLEEVTPGYRAKESIHTVTGYLANNGAKLTAEIDNLMNNWQQKLDEGARNLLVQDSAEKIGAKNTIGLEAFQADIRVQRQEEKKGETAPALIGEDGEGGVLNEIIDKTHRSESLTESDIYKLMKATEGSNIRIFPEGGETDGKWIQWTWVDENGKAEIPAKNICINPLLEEDEKVIIADNFIYDPSSLGFWGKLGNEVYSGVRESISEITEKATSNPGEAKTAVEIVIGAGGALGKIGGKTVIEYLDQVYILGPARIFDALMPGGKELTGQEYLVEYAGGIVPVLMVTAVKRAALKQGMGFLGYKVLAETAAYPIKLPIDVGKFLFEKWEMGKLGDVLSNPHVTIMDELYKKVGNGRIRSPKMGEIARHMTRKDKLEKIKHRIEKADGIKKNSWINFSGTVDEIVALAEKELGKGLQSTDLDTIIKDLDTEISKLDNKINLLRSTVKAELQEKIKQNPKALTEADVPAKKGDLLTTQKLITERINDLEAEKQKMLKQASTMTPSELAYKEKMFARRTTQLEAFNARIRVHIDGHLIHPVEGKWRGHARGIIGMATLAAVMIGVSKLRADDPGMEIPELNNIDSEVEFFGFSESDNETGEGENPETTEDEKKNEIKVENSPAYIRPFLERMSEIKGMYGTEFEFLGNPEALMTASDEKIEQKVGEIKNIHAQMIIDVKETIRENKEAIKKYYKEQKEIPIYIKKNNLNAFFALTEDEGEISLEYMDETDFSVTMWDLVDFNRDNAENLLDGSYSQLWDAGSYLIPFYGSVYRDGRSMVRHFGRGHTLEGFKSLGWATVGTVCDVATVVSLGSSALLTTGVKGVIRGGVAAGLRMNRLGKVLSVMEKLKKIKTGEHIPGTLLGKGLNTALTHSGKATILGIGADASQQLIQFPRSESISIDKL